MFHPHLFKCIHLPDIRNMSMFHLISDLQREVLSSKIDYRFSESRFFSKDQKLWILLTWPFQMRSSLDIDHISLYLIQTLSNYLFYPHQSLSPIPRSPSDISVDSLTHIEKSGVNLPCRVMSDCSSNCFYFQRIHLTPWHESTAFAILCLTRSFIRVNLCTEAFVGRLTVLYVTQSRDCVSACIILKVNLSCFYIFQLHWESFNYRHQQSSLRKL